MYVVRDLNPLGDSLCLEFSKAVLHWAGVRLARPLLAARALLLGKKIFVSVAKFSFSWGSFLGWLTLYYYHCISDMMPQFRSQNEKEKRHLFYIQEA